MVTEQEYQWTEVLSPYRWEAKCTGRNPEISRRFRASQRAPESKLLSEEVSRSRVRVSYVTKQVWSPKLCPGAAHISPPSLAGEPHEIPLAPELDETSPATTDDRQPTRHTNPSILINTTDKMADADYVRIPARRYTRISRHVYFAM